MRLQGTLEHRTAGYPGSSAVWGRVTQYACLMVLWQVFLSRSRMDSGWWSRECVVAALQVDQSSWTELQPALSRWRRNLNSPRRAPVVPSPSLCGLSHLLWNKWVDSRSYPLSALICLSGEIALYVYAYSVCSWEEMSSESPTLPSWTGSSLIYTHCIYKL